MKTYRDRVRYLITRLYEPGTIENHDVKMTTPMIYEDLCTIIPSKAFDEYDVVEVLEEEGFQPQYEQKLKRNKTKKSAEPETFDDVAYFWYLKKKTNE